MRSRIEDELSRVNAEKTKPSVSESTSQLRACSSHVEVLSQPSDVANDPALTSGGLQDSTSASISGEGDLNARKLRE